MAVKFPVAKGIIIGWIGVTLAIPGLIVWGELGKLSAAIGLFIACFGTGMAYGANVERDALIKKAGK